MSPRVCWCVTIYSTERWWTLTPSPLSQRLPATCPVLTDTLRPPLPEEIPSLAQQRPQKTAPPASRFTYCSVCPSDTSAKGKFEKACQWKSQRARLNVQSKAGTLTPPWLPSPSNSGSVVSRVSQKPQQGTGDKMLAASPAFCPEQYTAVWSAGNCITTRQGIRTPIRPLYVPCCLYWPTELFQHLGCLFAGGLRKSRIEALEECLVEQPGGKRQQDYACAESFLLQSPGERDRYQLQEPVAHSHPQPQS